MEKIKVTVDGYEVVEKVVKSAGNSGHIYLPKSWVGRRVKVILLDPAGKESEQG